MAKTVIQVPVDEALLKKLDNLSQKQRKARAEVIRQACRQFLKEAEAEELDRVYRDAYRKTPETPDFGESQVSMLKDILSDEEW